MHAPLYVAPQPVQLPDPSAAPPELTDLLRQMLDVQRDQLAMLRTLVANQDTQTKWRAFLLKWAGEFPDLGSTCKQVLPALERAYLAMIRDVTDRLRTEDADDLMDEFVLNEFLDKYGIRLGQLGTIVSQISPLADAAPPPADTPPPA